MLLTTPYAMAKAAVIDALRKMTDGVARLPSVRPTSRLGTVS
jgi:hypothetical protein